jgi:hypothetical protein
MKIFHLNLVAIALFNPLYFLSQNVSLIADYGSIGPQGMLYDCITKSDDGLIITGAFSESFDIDPSTSELVVAPINNYSCFIQSLNQEGALEWAQVLRVNSAYLALDNEDNLIVAGIFTETTDFDPGPDEYFMSPSNGLSIYVLKINSTGQFLWALNFDGANGFAGVKCDPFGNVLVSGEFANEMDMDPGTGESIVTTAEYFSTFLTMLDQDGQLIWARQIESAQLWPGSNRNQFFAFDDYGNLYFGGTFYQYVDFNTEIPGDSYSAQFSPSPYENFVVKFDLYGEISWVRIFGSSGDDEYVRAIDTDAEGNVYLVGRFRLYCDFDNGASGDAELLSAPGNAQDGYIVKYLSNGDYAWSLLFDGGSFGDAHNVRVTANDEIVAMGFFNGGIDTNLSPTESTFNNTPNSGYFSFRINTDSTQINYRSYQGITMQMGGSPYSLISPLQNGDGYYFLNQFYQDIIQFEGNSSDTLLFNPLYINKIGIIRYGNPSTAGCTDPIACNYDPEATVDDGSCVASSIADLDADCLVGVSDLLIMLDYFGCLNDCPEVDLNGDGIVGVDDIIIWVGG